MKKNSSMQGTLNKLFGKKTASNNSLYANNPPWILVQGTKKASVDYTEEVHNSFAFLDDSGTATLKSRPGPRVRPVLQFSTSNTDPQGLAVPTPSVPAGFTDNASIGNGSKLNGNYRLYSSVGDLRLTNYYDDDYHDDDDDDGIPAPPSMPPPPPPTMAPPPPPPPQKSPPSSAISSPSSPSPPDFIPPTPNSSLPVPPSFLPTDQSTVPRVEQHQTNNVTKWKSETVLNPVTKDLPMTLPNRFSLNPAAFQQNQGQTNFSAEPQSTLPRSFKIPPPAPARTSSMQLQEPQNIGNSKDPPQSPVRSSFNPSFQAKLFTAKLGQQSLNDTLNKRKSMLIMEDLPDFSDNSDQRLEKTGKMTDTVSSRVPPLKENTPVPQNINVELNKGIKNEDINNKMESLSMSEDQPQQPYPKLNSSVSEFTSIVSKQGEGQKYSQNGTDRNTLNKRGYTQEIHKTSKPTVKCISIKPIISDLSLSNSNGSKHNSLTKEMEVFSQELTRIDKEVNTKPEKSFENVNECLPPPPPKAPPPPPQMTVQTNRQSITPLSLPVQNITPPKTPPSISSATPPPAPPFRMPSPLLSPKPKTISVTPKPQALVPPPPPPKAPPAPPPLPSSDGPSSSVPLLEALQTKQQTLRKIPKSIEVRPAQTTPMPSADNEQKIRVGKIKGELEALFSPKKDEQGERLKNSRIEANKNSNGNFSQSGENKLVNSLMMKVPLLPPKVEKEDVDADNSEWVPKSNNMDIQIPEPDYLPASPAHKLEKPTYAKLQNKIPKATLDVPVTPLPVASTQKDTTTAGVLENSIPTYKPHRETKLLTETIRLDELPVQISQPVADVSINLASVPQHREIANVEPSVKQESPLNAQAESTMSHPVTGEQVEANSPMALLMAAQKRAQKAKSLDRGNLPKISVTSGLMKSSSVSPYNERRANTFVVFPNKENTRKFSQEDVTSFTSNSTQNSDFLSNSSTRTDGDLPFSDIRRTLGRDADNSNDKFSVQHLYNSADIPASTTNRHEDYLKPKSTAFDNHFSTVPNSTESPSFNISSFPSPVPDRKLDSKIEYEIIPPPAEFMNSPVPSISSSMQQENRSYDYDHDTSLRSDLIPNYDRNNSVVQPFPSLSTTSNLGYNNYSSDNYGTAQRGSLIKKRLYMPEPESSWSYGKNTSSLRSSTLPGSYMNSKSSSNMVLDPRRSNTTSRFLPQGRREYSENINRIVPPMTDLKYKSQSSDYSMGQSSSSRAQSKQPNGMTFTVRPGTRQPISQMYQGGYL